MHQALLGQPCPSELLVLHNISICQKSSDNFPHISSAERLLFAEFAFFDWWFRRNIRKYHQFWSHLIGKLTKMLESSFSDQMGWQKRPGPVQWSLDPEFQRISGYPGGGPFRRGKSVWRQYTSKFSDILCYYYRKCKLNFCGANSNPSEKKVAKKRKQ